MCIRDRIYTIAQTLGHLVTILVKYQSVRDNSFVRDGIEYLSLIHI